MKKTLLAKSVAIHGCWCCMVFLLAGGIPSVALAQTQTIRIVTYNIDADQGEDGAAFTLPQPGLIAPSSGGSVTNGGVLEGIGEEVVNGDPAQPIDILALEETTSNPTTIQPIVDGLNAYYSTRTNPARYAMSPYQATQSGGSANNEFGNGPNALVYNTNTIQLLASFPVDPPGGTNNLGSVSGEYREVMRYEFAPAGVTPTTNLEFYIYVSHYKASAGVTNEGYRLGEAQIVRNDEAVNLPASARVLYVGDYNPDDTSSEPGYQTILSNSAPDGVQQGQGIDPLNTSASTNIDWSDTTTDTNILFMLTEEGYELRYRDDLQVMTSNVYYDVAGGLQYVPGTYHAFGNNATIPWGSSVVTNLNTALSGIPTNADISAAQCYTNLTTATDHLPVVADYTLYIPPPPPLASFTGSPTSGVVPLNVSFTDTSSGSITGWAWAFGDGNTSTSQNPTNVYLNPGTYSVQEIASGVSGVSTNVRSDYIVVNCPTITVLTSNLPNAIVGSAYNQAFAASGGTGPYTYSVNPETLPPGLSLSSGGVLSGTPTVAGVYAFTVTATDAKECSGAQSYTLTPICLTLSLKATGITLSAKGGSKDLSVKVKGGECSWVAVSNDPFITITSGDSGTGNGAVGFTVSDNTNFTERVGTMTIAGEVFTVDQAAGGCTYTLSPKHGKFKATGGSATVTVKTTYDDCAWTVVKNGAFGFITITGGSSGVGGGTVSYTVSPNSDPDERVGSITIGGELFLITQAGAK